MSVPASVMVPLAWMGPPDVVKPVVPPETSTEVTLPVPLTVAQTGSPEPLISSICPLVPVPPFAFKVPVRVIPPLRAMRMLVGLQAEPFQ